MAIERPAVQIDPESELALVLRRAAAAGEPVLVVTGDEQFELDVHPASGAQTPGWTPPNADQIARCIAGIHKAAGGWRDLVDVDALTAELYARRRMATRPPVER